MSLATSKTLVANGRVAGRCWVMRVALLCEYESGSLPVRKAHRRAFAITKCLQQLRQTQQRQRSAVDSQPTLVRGSFDQQCMQWQSRPESQHAEQRGNAAD